MAQMIREAVDTYVKREPQPTLEERKRRARSVVGEFASGMSDISVEHDRHLEDVFSR